MGIGIGKGASGFQANKTLVTFLYPDSSEGLCLLFALSQRSMNKTSELQSSLEQAHVLPDS